MTDNPATVDDIAARWRPLTDAEDIVASALLGDAWAYLKNRVKDLESRLDDDTQDPQLVIAVEASMVLRVLKTPDGFRSKSEAVDDYSATFTGAVADGSLAATPEELLLLMSAGSSTRSRRLLAYGECYTTGDCCT